MTTRNGTTPTGPADQLALEPTRSGTAAPDHPVKRPTSRSSKPTPAEPRLTSSQAARRLGVHRNSILAWTQQGDLDCEWTPGGQRRYLPSVLDSFMGARRG